MTKPHHDPPGDDQTLAAALALSLRRWWGAYLLVVALALWPWITYAVSPSFYTTYILDYQMREYQAVEMVTFASGLIAAALLAWGAARLGRQRPARDAVAPNLQGKIDRNFPTGLAGVTALAAFFFAGEEVNWGQTFLHWGVGERQQERDITLNLHNTLDIVSIQSLGSIFLYAVFLALPTAWLLRKKLNLPRFWHPAIPVGPAVFALLLGLAYTYAKDLYIALNEIDVSQPTTAFYIDFVEQFKEIKEMFCAVALMLFGLGIVKRTAPHRTAAYTPAT